MGLDSTTEKRNSEFGIASFGISMGILAIMLCLISAGSSSSSWGEAIVLGIVVQVGIYLVMLPSCVVGIVFGIAALVRKERGKAFSISGIAITSLIVMAFFLRVLCL